MNKEKSRKIVVVSTAAFWLTFIAIVIAHNITGTAGVHINFSISKYVGLSFPSAIAFLIVNSIISFAIWRYLKPRLKTDLQKFLLFIIVVTLIGLSLFPIGLFDNIIPEPLILGRTPISFLHVLTSRTMFVVMAAFAAYTYFIGEKYYSRAVRVNSLAFTIYAALCIFIFIFFPQVFWAVDLIFESLYIALFWSVVLAF